MIKLSKILSEIKVSRNFNQKEVRELYWKKHKELKSDESRARLIKTVNKYDQYVTNGYGMGTDLLIASLPQDKLNELYKELILIK